MIQDIAGGGTFAVIPFTRVGKRYDVCLVSEHKGTVLSLDYSPFNNDLIASLSKDSTIWHKRKVRTCSFNPYASNVLTTSSAGASIKV
ncbi:hypothetical protein EDI_210780 [Entamoeba dispar SAW760]|uniref:Uncharacterized protein n=1 Tax=Entamoeba dispar (strain ATCC PRA-260 / SAW760) TaxID=370354 RepID=B0E7B1_ENTDS|nr:uncharacterized protein EDI_210780 [Entamoeba dispar SAW760]EDR29593.1 hypothetical protein EDI_210780 [Entamoeba dispar SAW760]|eukprot:EDR29593.1 hypothetical protein EDI_210780 [Entamoeba dispar SAW760]